MILIINLNLIGDLFDFLRFKLDKFKKKATEIVDKLIKYFLNNKF